MIKRINYRTSNPAAFKGLIAMGDHTTTIPTRLKALVELRVSQINGCAYCIWLHSREARAAGESQERLDCVPAWEESGMFDERECAALAWAEAVTRISETNAPDHLFEALKPHFSEKEIVDLTFIISVMNTWNRINVAFRGMPDKSDS